MRDLLCFMLEMQHDRALGGCPAHLDWTSRDIVHGQTRTGRIRDGPFLAMQTSVGGYDER